MGQLTPIEDHRDLADRVDKLEGARGDKTMSETTDTTMGMDAAPPLPSLDDEHRLTQDEYAAFCDSLANVRSRVAALEKNTVKTVGDSMSGTITVQGDSPLIWTPPEPFDIKTQVKQALDEWDEEKANKAVDLAQTLKDAEEEVATQNATIAALAEQIAQFEATLGGKTCKRLLKACEEWKLDPGEDVVGTVIEALGGDLKQIRAISEQLDNLERAHSVCGDERKALLAEVDRLKDELKTSKDLRARAPIVGLAPQIEHTLRQAAANETALHKACEELGIEPGEDVTQGVIDALVGLVALEQTREGHKCDKCTDPELARVSGEVDRLQGLLTFICDTNREGVAALAKEHEAREA